MLWCSWKIVLDKKHNKSGWKEENELSMLLNFKFDCFLLNEFFIGAINQMILAGERDRWTKH